MVGGIEALESSTKTICYRDYKAEDAVLSIACVKLEDEIAARLSPEKGKTSISIESMRLATGSPVPYCQDVLWAALLEGMDLDFVKTHRPQSGTLLGFFEQKEERGRQLCHHGLNLRSGRQDSLSKIQGETGNAAALSVRDCSRLQAQTVMSYYRLFANKSLQVYAGPSQTSCSITNSGLGEVVRSKKNMLYGTVEGLTLGVFQ